VRRGLGIGKGGFAAGCHAGEYSFLFLPPRKNVTHGGMFFDHSRKMCFMGRMSVPFSRFRDVGKGVKHQLERDNAAMGGAGWKVSTSIAEQAGRLPWIRVRA